MREQVTNCQHRRIRRGIRQVGELRNIPRDWIVERKLAFVTQLHYRHGGETFCHGGDAKNCFGSDGGVVSLLTHAGSLQPDEFAINDHAEDRTRCLGSLHKRFEEFLDLGKGSCELLLALWIGELGWRDSSSREFFLCGREVRENEHKKEQENLNPDTETHTKPH